MTIPDCRNFSGYKPCFPGTACYEGCVDPTPYGTRILIVNLDAMGNVLVTTSILPALKRTYPVSHISWITLKNAAPLLAHNPFIDDVYVWEPENWLLLRHIDFDLVLNADKSRRSGAFLAELSAKETMGFGINGRGAIVPLNPEARENYLLGLNDHLKFRVNQKTGPQLACDQFNLPYARDRYVFRFTEEEVDGIRAYAREHGLLESDDLIVGFNTGCSELYPNKKLRVEQHVSLINRISAVGGMRVLLLGGREDTMRNAEIARRAGGTVVSTPTTEGVRRGIGYIDLCDVVVTGDSFGMHASIARGKHVIVWFGVSCPAEIDLFDNGLKVIPEGLACSPCWKRTCPYGLECVDMVDLDRIVNGVCEAKGRKDVLRALATSVTGPPKPADGLPGRTV